MFDKNEAVTRARKGLNGLNWHVMFVVITLLDYLNKRQKTRVVCKSSG